jgi:hypothetical protein
MSLQPVQSSFFRYNHTIYPGPYFCVSYYLRISTGIITEAHIPFGFRPQKGSNAVVYNGTNFQPSKNTLRGSSEYSSVVAISLNPYLYLFWEKGAPTVPILLFIHTEVLPFLSGAYAPFRLVPPRSIYTRSTSFIHLLILSDYQSLHSTSSYRLCTRLRHQSSNTPRIFLNTLSQRRKVLFVPPHHGAG